MTIDIEKLAKEHCHYQQSNDQFSITLYGLEQICKAYAAKVLEDKECEIAELKNEHNGISRERSFCGKEMAVSGMFTGRYDYCSPNDGQCKECAEKDEAYAAKVLEDKEREIAELKTTVRSDNSKVIAALNAHINDLREALEVCKYDCHTGEVIGIAQQALSKTPAQSLQTVINETIEMCAEEVEERGSRFEAEIIRALKDNYDR